MNPRHSMISVIALICAVATLATSAHVKPILKTVSRGAFAENVRGDFTLDRIVGDITYDCPEVIKHTTWMYEDDTKRTLKLVHNTINQDGARCESKTNGKALLYFESKFYNTQSDFTPIDSYPVFPDFFTTVLRNSGFNQVIVAALNKQLTEAGTTENYFLGYEEILRECGGKTVFSRGTTSFLVRPFTDFSIAKIETEFQEGNVYMLMVPVYKRVVCVYSTLLPNRTTRPVPVPSSVVDTDDESEDEGEDEDGSEPISPIVTPIGDVLPTVSVMPSPTGDASNVDIEGPDDGVNATISPDVSSGSDVTGSTDGSTDGITDSPTVGDEDASESSTPEGTPDADGDGVCFPASATVKTSDGRRLRMDEIKSGDKIQSGHNKYSRVFGFSHLDASRKFEFVWIHLSSGHSLKVTSKHFIYVNKGQAKSAGSVRVGETMETEDGQEAEIIEIKRSMDIGLYNPQTEDGDIVVSGVKASTFTMDVEMKFAHAALLPLRALYKACGIDALAFALDTMHIRSLINSVPKA